jgi:anaerobic magnesium-protoporphyrin IX monomethyl ester cyclase
MISLKALFIEPPKDLFFAMGGYLPPPLGIIQIAAYLEKNAKDVEVEILDCNAGKVDWRELAKRIESSHPDIVASASLATCNTYAVVRTLETAKTVDPSIMTVTGGQHFTSTAEESLKEYPVIDVIVRGEGEQTFTDLAKNAKQRTEFPRIKGISFRNNGQIINNPPRPLIDNVDELPYPGYHLVKDHVEKYHFSMMSGENARYVLIEGSRGCPHECTFCTQWRHWQGKWRLKSPKRIAAEIEYCHSNFDSGFVWLTDDNFGAGTRAGEIADEIIKTRVQEDITWFVQARCDDIIRNKEALPKLRKSGLNWVLLGVENSEPSTLEAFKKTLRPSDAKTAVRLLKENDIFAHVMLIIGQREDTLESIKKQREFAINLDPDLAFFSALTPFPGTEIYQEAKRNGWIEDFNWAHYDMVHAIMPTETLSRIEVQEQLYECYRGFYGPLTRKLRAVFSTNALKRRVSRHMARRGLLGQFESMFQG